MSTSQHTRKRRRPTLAVLALLLGAAGVRADDEQPFPAAERGHALLGDALQLGGYLTLRVRDIDGEPARFDARDTSLFVTWTPAPKWRVFVEAEVEDLLSIDRRGVHGDELDVTLERLHADYAATPWLGLRAGKFLTPVGRWNLTHADPLQWTVTRPLVTALPFAMLATGLAAHGSLPLPNGETLDYVAYLDDSRALDPAHLDSTSEELEQTTPHHEYDHAGGAQLRWHLLDDRAELGISYSDFRMRGEAARTHLAGFDARLLWRGVELSSEGIYSVKDSDRTSVTEWGAFVQAVAPVAETLSAVVRFERYDGASTGTRGIRLGTVGLAWRPRPAIAVKLEYRAGEHNARVAPDGLLASFGLLF